MVARPAVDQPPALRLPERLHVLGDRLVHRKAVLLLPESGSGLQHDGSHGANGGDDDVTFHAAGASVAHAAAAYAGTHALAYPPTYTLTYRAPCAPTPATSDTPTIAATSAGLRLRGRFRLLVGRLVLGKKGVVLRAHGQGLPGTHTPHKRARATAIASGGI